ncbi:MAG: hypothetical protein RRY29_06285 [Desulfovibrionaceae bacterium]
MGIDPTIAVLYAQTNYTARFSHDAAVAPQTAAAMSRVMAEELARQEHQQVQKLDKGGEVQVGDKQGGTSQGHTFGSRRKNRQMVPEEMEDENAPSGDNPLLGNLLNVKV